MKRLPAFLVTMGLVAVGLALAACATAPTRDIDVERLSRSLTQLEADPKIGALAPAELANARTAVQQLREARGDERGHRVYLADRRVDIAWAAAQAAELAQEQIDLQREHDRLQLAAARRDAEQARIELDRLRLQNQIRAEEAERQARDAEEAREQASQDAAAARAEAEQAKRLADAQSQEAALAKKEARLAEAAATALRVRLGNLQATRGDLGMQMSLDDVAFAPGQASLKPEAREALGKLVDFVSREPGKHIRIEGHTDATGSPNANLVLSQRRADAVRDALIAAGVEAGRIDAVGVGAERPVASNATADGRARNRRVDVILVEKQ